MGKTMLPTRTLSALFISVIPSVIFVAPHIRAGEAGPVAIHTTIPNLKFKDIRFVPRSLADLGEAQAYVLLFTNTTCPVAQKYWPKLKQLDAELRSRGVQFVAVNSAADDSIV